MMTQTILIILLILTSIILALTVFLLINQKRQNDQLLEKKSQIDELSQSAKNIDSLIKEGFKNNRDESLKLSKDLREEISGSIKLFQEMLSNRIGETSTLMKNQLENFSNQLATLTKQSKESLDKNRETMETKLREIQEGNQKKLDEMKSVVDEKLQSTLEKRLGDSFKIVSERLEKVHQGLGDMQKLATGVGDLKKVLTNVKTRGTWGEFQLGHLLEQMLSPSQYEKNVATKPNTSERVEYAIKLPGAEDGQQVWLPLDAKFPMDAYQQLIDAYEIGIAEDIESVRKQLETRIKNSAKEIVTKYVEPPSTTDFALMYLPVEGLYAEVLRMPGLIDTLQKKYRVTITGPTTLTALINSLQMGFRTLAVEKRSSEVRSLLGAVKNQFGKFGDLLDKTHRKLSEASNTIEDATKKSRYIQSRLGKVEELPEEDSKKLLGGD